MMIEFPPQCRGLCPLEKIDLDLEFQGAITSDCPGREPRAAEVNWSDNKTMVDSLNSVGKNEPLEEFACRNLGISPFISEVLDNS